MNLYGDKILLRALELSDIELLRSMINNPQIEAMVEGWSFPISTVQQQNWYNRIINDNSCIRLAIETLEGTLIGAIDLRQIDWKNRSGFVGIKIGSECNRGKGYGKDAIDTVMKYAFEELNLNRLETTILSYNEPSKQLFTRKCGWKIEGEKKQAVYKGNQYQNQLFVAILKDEYLSLKYGDE